MSGPDPFEKFPLPYYDCLSFLKNWAEKITRNVQYITDNNIEQNLNAY
jgi:hypothetical protein